MSATVTELRPGARLVSAETGAILPDGPPPAVPPSRVRLTAWQRMEVESARKLLMDTPDLLATGKPPAYVAGLLEGAAANLLNILDTIASVV